MGLFVDIRKNFGAFQLNVQFAAKEGVTGLLGASGCGKSVTLKCIAGVETPEEGRIELDGRVLFDSKQRINLSPQRRHVGYLFQHYALFPNMTVEQNIAAGLRRSAKKTEVADRLIAAFCLEECRGKHPRQLSGGQQQRVALARILASEPAALLLDEPFSALDSYLKWQVELELTQRLAQFSGPVLFVTHDREEIFRQCPRVCVLANGRAQPIQTTQELFDAPTTLSACRLSGCQNLSRVRILGEGQIRAVDWGVSLTSLKVMPQGCAYVGIRAHHIRPADGPGQNRIRCQILQRIEGRLTVTLLLAVSMEQRETALLRMEWEKSDIPPSGFSNQMWVELPPKDLLLLSGT
ncbi:MAG: ATP-binding cassette domain-containing protein [Lawsonibacter sp.]|nr:ATP-binding cassette domain-containing protein [Lawsonibacter sp.]